MTMPTQQGTSDTILLELGKISTQIAVMDEKLKDLPDHETRIRLLETSKAKLIGACVTLSAIAGGGASWIAVAIAHR